MVSLDVYLEAMKPTQVFEGNITHNLRAMAQEAGIHQHLWKPEELGITQAGDLIKPLTAAFELMTADHERFRKHNPENGWGSFEGFIVFVKRYLDACVKDPEATIRVCR